MLWCALSIFFVLNILSCRLCILSVRSSLSVSLLFCLSIGFVRCSGPVCSVCIASISLWNVMNKVISSGDRRKPHDLISNQHKYGINILPSRSRTTQNGQQQNQWTTMHTREKEMKEKGTEKKLHTNSNFLCGIEMIASSSFTNLFKEGKKMNEILWVLYVWLSLFHIYVYKYLYYGYFPFGCVCCWLIVLPSLFFILFVPQPFCWKHNRFLSTETEWNQLKLYLIWMLVFVFTFQLRILMD